MQASPAAQRAVRTEQSITEQNRTEQLQIPGQML